MRLKIRFDGWKILQNLNKALEKDGDSSPDMVQKPFFLVCCASASISAVFIPSLKFFVTL